VNTGIASPFKTSDDSAAYNTVCVFCDYFFVSYAILEAYHFSVLYQISELFANMSGGSGLGTYEYVIKFPVFWYVFTTTKKTGFFSPDAGHFESLGLYNVSMFLSAYRMHISDLGKTGCKGQAYSTCA
jgi:hypothetical protein